jgi:predicted dienelactone hydrolase
MTRIRLAALAVAFFATVPLAARGQEDPGRRGSTSVARETVAVEASDGTSFTVQIRLPADASGPRPLVIIQHGFFSRASFWLPLAEHLASHGFAVAVVGQPNALEVDPSIWKRRLRAAVDTLEAVNKKEGGPLAGRFDFDRVALLGHSYGGVASIMVAAEDPRVKTVVAIAPGDLYLYRDPFMKAAAKLSQPILFVAAEADGIVPTPLFARPAFERATNALFVEIKGAGHLRFADVPIFPGGDEQRATLARHATGWLEAQLGVRDDRASWTDGTAAERARASGELSDVRRSAPPASPPPPSRTKGLLGALGEEGPR